MEDEEQTVEELFRGVPPPVLAEPVLAEPVPVAPPDPEPVVTEPASVPDEKQVGILLNRARCTVFSKQIGNRHGYPMFNGYFYDKVTVKTDCKIRSSALRCTLRDCPYGWTHFELVGQAMASNLIELKCCAEHTLGNQIVEMLKIAPLNPTVRARVMSIVGQMPSPELDTWKKIKDWIESTYEDPALDEKPVPPKPSSFSIPILCSRTETGQCTYSARSTASASYKVGLDTIRDMASGDGIASMADLIFELKADATNDVDTGDWEIDWDQDVEHNNHDMSDADDYNYEVDVSNLTIEDHVVTLIRNSGDVELMRRLDIQPTPPLQPPF